MSSRRSTQRLDLTQKSPYLSVIIPIYQKEKTIKTDVEAVLQALENTPYDFEIIPVVDGTKVDRSLQQVSKIRDPRIFPTGYEQNRGKGYAIRFGMKNARGEVVTFIDSGQDIDPQGIVMLLEHLKWYNADVIIGSKLHAASIVNYTPWRRLMTYVYYLMVKLLFGLRVRDTQTGLKAYKRTVLERVLPRLTIQQFAFDIEILAVANHLGYRKIYDAPVKVHLDPLASTVRMWGKHGVFQVMWDTLVVWYRLKIMKFYDDDYKKSLQFDRMLKMFVVKR